jgi:methanogenic corrinoid protein MtbC1
VNRVSEAGKLIRDAIESRRDELAKAIVAQQWKIRPDLERRYGATGFSKCLEDANFHLRYLSEAIEASEPKLFVDYIAWAKVMLASRNVPTEDLTNHLEVVRDVIADSLPSEMRESVRSYIHSALDYLRRHQAQELSFPEYGEPLSEVAESYLAALLRYERHVAIRLILDAVDAGASVKDIYCFVFERCQREIGRLWQLNMATVAQEHYCTASTQLAMALLYPRIFAEKRTKIGTLVAACVPGELHEIGPRLVCDLLEMEGWDTTYLGASVPIAALLETVKARRPHVLAISAAMTFHVNAVRQLILALRGSNIAPLPQILVGGYAFRLAPELWRDVGADGFAKDSLETIDLLKNRRQ